MLLRVSVVESREQHAQQAKKKIHSKEGWVTSGKEQCDTGYDTHGMTTHGCPVVALVVTPKAILVP